VINFPDDPVVNQAFVNAGTIYTCISVAPIVWNASPVAAGIPDAPVNNMTYGRKDAAWVALTKDSVGLGDVDNTSDADKPVSTAQQTALNAKEGTINPGTGAQWWRGDKTWQPITPAVIGAVAKAGDTMTGDLTISNVGGSSSLVLNKTGANYAQIVGRNAGADRWYLHLANNTDDFSLHRAPDSGGTTAALSISRNNGAMIVYGSGADSINATKNITTNGYFYQGAATGENQLQGGINTGIGRIVGAQGMGMYYDGGNANYLSMGAGASSPWSWQWIRNTGALNWLNSANSRLFGVDPGGAISLVNYINIDQWYGLNMQGYNNGDGNYAFCEIAYSNPSWNPVHIRSWHQRGQWAGFQLFADGANNVIQFVMSNAGSWGTVRAASFEVQSDERIKQGVALLDRQHEAYMGLAPISWKWPLNPDAVDDGIPKDTRDKWGFSAQNVSQYAPLAVMGDVNAVDAEGKPVTASVDVIPIAAMTVLEVQSLWARVEAIEAQLKGAS